MKVVFSCLLLFLAAVAQALSATGDRLLSIWEDVEDKKLYSKYLEDLEGTYFPCPTVNDSQLLIGLICRPRLQDHTCDSQAGQPQVAASGRESL